MMMINTTKRSTNHRHRRHRAGGGTCHPPPQKNKFWGARAQQNLWGTCKKKLKRLMKKPNIQQRKCSACHPLATDTLPLINSFVDHTVVYVGADSSQTPQIQFVDILYVW